MARAMPTNKPLVWLPACHRNLDLSDPGGYTVLADRYALAVCQLGMQPVLFPMAGESEVAGLLPLVDGVLLTGSPSNVEATRFGGAVLDSDLIDPRRDRLTMALVRAAVAAGMSALTGWYLAETGPITLMSAMSGSTPSWRGMRPLFSFASARRACFI